MRIRAQQGFALGHASTGDDAEDRMLLETIRLKLLRPNVVVQVVQWSTMGFTVPAGARVDVPIVVEKPSLGEYVFACTNSGSLDFSLTLRSPTSLSKATPDARPPAPAAAPGSSEPFVMLPNASRGEGSFSVPCDAIPGLLVATLDNTAARVAEVTLQAHVTLTPMDQAVSAEIARLRASHAAQASHLAMLQHHEAGLRAQELELERKLRNVRLAREVAGQMHEEDATVCTDLETAINSLGALHADGSYEQGEEGAIKADLETSRQLRLAAIQGRRSVRDRAKAQEERRMRAQVINFDPMASREARARTDVDMDAA